MTLCHAASILASSEHWCADEENMSDKGGDGDGDIESDLVT